jgi:hypothetical protein
MLERALIEDALPPIAAVRVAHYTRIGTLCHFIPHGAAGWASAWATPVQFLNDRKELLLGLEVLQDASDKPPRPGRKVSAAITYLRTTAGKLTTDAFQMSFSGNPDELGQWRGYAANGMGCSVITDAKLLKKVADVAGWVIYDAKEQGAFARKVLRKLRNETDNDKIEQTLVAAASFMKHEGFRPEMEFRILKFPAPDQVRFRETGDRLVPFVDFLEGKPPLPINRVIIGPGWQLAGLKRAEWTKNHVVQGIQRLLTARGLHATAIESSEIPYDPK